MFILLQGNHINNKLCTYGITTEGYVLDDKCDYLQEIR